MACKDVSLNQMWKMSPGFGTKAFPTLLASEPRWEFRDGVTPGRSLLGSWGCTEGPCELTSCDSTSQTVHPPNRNKSLLLETS